jgi:lipopolysaccharide assembly protein A
MQFLKTLFWVVLAVVMVLFARDNWHVVEVNLWAGLVADIKLPILVLIAYLIGLVPTIIIYRARIWSLRRRLDTQNPSNAGPTVVPNPIPEPVRRSSAPGEPLAERDVPDREATDSKAWPTA